MTTTTEQSSIAAPSDPSAWRERLSASLAAGDAGRRGSETPPLDRAKRLAEALLSERGEASGVIVARELHESLRALDAEGRLAFYGFLAKGFLPEPERLRAAAEAYLAEPTAHTAARLADAAEPKRQELLRRMNMSPAGTSALVALRKDLLDHLRDAPELKPLDADLRHLFASWFNRGFLELRRIDWRSPAAVLDKLIAYEAVHEIHGWSDLKRRLAPDRRCFGFFHPALPGEPLIFVEVALVKGLSTAVQAILARDEDAEDDARARAEEADTAIFYSISNCQDGLRGVSFGNFLIKQVVQELRAEFPNLTRFSTLSPVPGFRRWLEKRLAADPAEAALLAPLKTDGWWGDAAQARAMRGPVLRLAATYLTTFGPKGPPDPVARFHLGNGARLEQINWLGNTAPRGIAESHGVMVNYLYVPEAIEANHEVFAHEGVVVRSRQVDALMDVETPAASLQPGL